MRVFQTREMRPVRRLREALFVLDARQRLFLAGNSRKVDHRAGKVEPRARPVVGAVVDAVFLGQGKLEDFVCQVVGTCRVSELVGNDADLSELLCQADHRLRKVLALVPIQPRRAHDEVARAQILDRLFARELGAPVGRDGLNRIGLHALALFATRKDVIGRHLNKLGAVFLARSSQMSRAQVVDCIGGLHIRLAPIDVGVRSSVDDDVVAF